MNNRRSRSQPSARPGVAAVTAPLDTITSYIPVVVLRRLAAEPAQIGSAHADRFPAAVLFADISGFTAIAERLARRGPAGAEELSTLLNAAFTQLISLIDDAGGDVVKFAGDGLLAVWPATDLVGENLAAVTRRAAACATAMHAALRAYAAAEVVRLAVRIAIGAGQVALLDVGGVLQRREVLLAGEPLLQTSAVLDRAEPGQVVCSADAWALLRDACKGQPLDGSVRLDEVAPPPPVHRPAPPQLSPDLAAPLQAYLPRAILAPLAAGQSDWVAELRRITVIFLNLPDLTHAAPLEQAQRIMAALQTALYRFEGSINKLSVDDKGVTLVAALGLPPLAHEDDAARAVSAALAMQAALAGLGQRAAVGIATGRAFCGVVGSDRRREYTMIGDVVNLAARLMQAAPGTVLCDAPTCHAAGMDLALDAVGPIRVKGKAEPVPVYRPRGPARRAALPTQAPPHPSLVGRAAERALLSGELQALLGADRAGVARPERASVVVVEGEAGVGKSRLVAELVEQAQAAGLRTLSGTGDAIEHSTPYFAWREVFGGLLRLDDLPEPARRQVTLDLLRADPQALRLAPLLDAVLPLELPDNEVTAQMTGQVRADNTRDLLVSLLRAATRGAPTVLVMEDAHWLDSASWALTLAVSRRVAPLLLVVVTRPPDEQGGHGDAPRWEQYDRLVHAPGTRRLRLEGLGATDTEALVRQRLGVASVAAEVAALVYDKAEGHPLFSEELASALRDAGLIRIVDGRCEVAPGVGDLHQLEFPDTVQGAIISRIDRLPPSPELTLKVASVIGRVFAFRILRAVHPFGATRPSLTDDLAVLERANLTMLDTPEPRLAYLFKHVITQEVTYNLLLFAQRRQLHRAVAEWHERTYAEDLAPFYPLLAYHWSRAEVTPKAVDYLERAGLQALQGGAYQEAVRFFSELLAMGGERRAAAGTPAAVQAARWELSLADAHQGLGELPELRRHVEAALALLGWPVPATRRKLTLGLPRHALRQLAHRLWPSRFVGRWPERRALLLEAARGYDRLNAVDFFASHGLSALYAAIKGANLAEGVGPSPELARLYATCGLNLGLLRLRRLAEAYLERALATARQVDDLAAQAWALQIAAVYDMGVGHWDQARARLTQVSELVRGVGDRRRVAEADALFAWVAYFQGDFADGAARFVNLYRDARRSGDVQAQSWGVQGQAISALRTGDLDRAAHLLTERSAPALAALLHWRRGEPAAAQQAVETTLPWTRRRPTKCYWFDMYAATAEVAVGLLEAAGGPAGQPAPAGRRKLAGRWGSAGGQELARWQELVGLAERACKGLWGYARVFPVGRPRAWLCQGLLHWLTGRPGRARAAWRRSLAAAERLAMRYDQGLAHYEIGRHAQGPERRAHLERAGELFAELGSARELAATRALLAEQAAGR